MPFGVMRFSMGGGGVWSSGFVDLGLTVLVRPVVPSFAVVYKLRCWD